MPVNIGTEKAKLYLGEVEISGGGGGGIEGGYNLSFSVDGNVTKFISVTPNDILTANPFKPIKANYNFVGWSETSGGSLITYPYTPTGDATLYANFENGYKSVNSNYGNSNPSSVSFVKDPNFPSSFEQVTFGGDVFIKIPTIYRKVNSTSSGQITGYTLSTGQIDSSYHPYPCFLAEDGSLLPYILIGKYMCTSTSRASSVSGTKQSITPGAGRQLCRNRGTGYQQFDVWMQRLWQDLICTKMTTVNINTGSGIEEDQLGIVWNKSGCWVDGVSYQGTTKHWVCSYKPSKYTDEATASTDGYVDISYTFGGTSGQEISKLGYDANNEFFNYPQATVSNSSYNTYYCDSVSAGASATHPVVSYAGGTDAGGGAFRCRASDDWSYTYGVRLCYKPLSA